MDPLVYFDNFYFEKDSPSLESFCKFILAHALDFLREKRHIQKRLEKSIFFHRKDQILLLLQSNRDLFLYLYSRLNNPCLKDIEDEFPFLRQYSQIEDIYTAAPETGQCAEYLRRDGVYLLEDRISAEALDEIKYYFKQRLLSSDRETYCLDGRERAYWSKADLDLPRVVQELFNHQMINEAVSSSLFVRVESSLILAERMVHPGGRAFAPLHWHVDNLSDQIKVMIPLSIIDEENAPMEYMIGSHNYDLMQENLRDRLYHVYQTAALKTASDCMFEDRFADSLDFARAHALACPTSAVLFDTRLLHKGGVCKPGHVRENLVVIFKAPRTRKNRLFQYLYGVVG